MSFTTLMVDKLWIKIVFHFARGSAAPVDFWFEAAPGDLRPSLTLSFVIGKIARLAVAAVPLESAARMTGCIQPFLRHSASGWVAETPTQFQLWV